MTIRNISKHLRNLFKFAIRRKLIAGLTANPTIGEEYKEELKAILDGDMPKEWFVPTEGRRLHLSRS